MYAYQYGLSESTFDDLVAACKALDAKLAELIESKAKGSA
jgi:DNA-binding Xre family transcriptional regulator